MFHPHGRQQLQRKGEAERSLIDPVDENLRVDMRAVGLQQPSQVLVGHLALRPGVLDDGLGRQRVEVLRALATGYTVFHLSASYRRVLGRHPINGFPFKAKTARQCLLNEGIGHRLVSPGATP